MKKDRKNLNVTIYFLTVIFCLSGLNLQAQVTVEDYERADRFRTKLGDLVYHGAVQPHWLDKTNMFWYRNQIPGGKEFLLVDADKKSRKPVFDHKRLADALSKVTEKAFTKITLPFDTLELDLKTNTITFVAEGFEWTCHLKTHQLKKGKASDPPLTPRMARRRQRRSRETRSPDGKWLAFVRDFNLFMRSLETSQEFQLTTDGNEDVYYADDVEWAPDSQKFATYYVTRGRETTVYLIESAPEDQMRPKMTSRPYALPGDVLTTRRPCVVFIQNRPVIKVKDELFRDAFRISDIHWTTDSQRFKFRYHQRGEQLTRMIEVNVKKNGEARTLFEEKATTFIDRYNLYVHYVDTSDEIIWSSERDGWRHLYLFDGKNGKLKNQITAGPWVVRGIEYVDEKKRQVYFRAGGKEANQDPYNIHYYRINFDGSGLVKLTEGDGSHVLSFSSKRDYYVDVYSRVDFPPVSVLKKTSDQQTVMELETADISDLLKTGWRMPEPFVAKGRDGQTDIYGVIYRPSHFDPAKSYPVIEYIYAGPHGSFVPKTFRANRSDQALAELGFILVQMDGMGTTHRSRSFHDVAWQNVGGAGFPDRIAWMKAAAERYPYMDITRVGIYGTSAGGQSSTGALLFHPDFYKVAVSSCGCHDNRMDKAVWNEQWMGYPVGPHYKSQSNVTNAPNLKGKLLLIVGEMDTNVPPQSTLQVVNALIKAKKDFDLIFMPGVGHSSGGDYGERRRRDYFVQHLLGIDPPDWNSIESND